MAVTGKSPRVPQSPGAQPPVLETRMAKRFAPVPHEAIDAVEPGDYIALLDMYSRAHSLRWKPITFTERELARRWQVSGRRVWRILDTLEALDLVSVDRGGRRTASKVEVYNPTNGVDEVKHSDQHIRQHSDQQNGAGSTDDMAKPDAQLAAQLEAQVAALLLRLRTETEPETEPEKVLDHVAGMASKTKARPAVKGQLPLVAVAPAFKADPIAEDFGHLATLWASEAFKAKGTRYTKAPKWSSSGEETRGLKSLLADDYTASDVYALIQWHWHGPDTAGNRAANRGLMTLYRHRQRYVATALEWQQAGMPGPDAVAGAGSSFAAMLKDLDAPDGEVIDVAFSPARKTQ